MLSYVSCYSSEIPEAGYFGKERSSGHIGSRGLFDRVLSWSVEHHTGQGPHLCVCVLAFPFLL